MSVKLVLLTSGENVISDIKELLSDDKLCGYLLSDPHKIEIRNHVLLVEDENVKNARDLEISMSPWIVLSKDKKIPVPPNSVITIVEPIDEVKKMYEEKVNGTNGKVSTSEDQSSNSY